MAKEYKISLHEPPFTHVIREGMELHLNQLAQEGWKMVSVIKESGYYYFFWERDGWDDVTVELYQAAN